MANLKGMIMAMLMMSVVVLIGCQSTARTSTRDSCQCAEKSKLAASDGQDDQAKPSKEDDAAERAANREKLSRELAIARVKLEKSRLAVDYQQADDSESVAKAKTAVEIAGKKLDNFESRDVPVRLDQGRLNLSRTEDRLLEAEEELAQLEMMYTENDLADKTAEIVLNRGRRRIERSRADFEIKKQELETLESRTIPLEREELQSAVTEKMFALQSAQRSAAASLMDKRIALMSAEAEVSKLVSDLEELDKEATP